MDNVWHKIAHGVAADLVSDLDVSREPVMRMVTGVYHIEVRHGILMPSPYPDLWAFCDLYKGNVLALFAEFVV